MRKVKKNNGGFIVTSELLLIVTILVIGLIVGMVTIRNSVNAELEDVAEAIGSLDQSYEYMGINADNSTANTAGSLFIDGPDDAGMDGSDGNINGDENEWTFVPAMPHETGWMPASFTQ